MLSFSSISAVFSSLQCSSSLKVKDLFADIKDGKILMALLEILSGHNLVCCIASLILSIMATPLRICIKLSFHP